MVQKNIFDCIRENDIEKSEKLVENDETIVNSIAPQKPYDTRGMSPFQVLLCTGWHRKIKQYFYTYKI